MLNISNKTRLNHTIQAPQLRVIDENGTQLGIFSKQEALKMAQEQELDLVEISPNAKPPVAKIVDWGKFNYQRTKQQQRNKRNTKASELKQIRLGLKISEHDLGVKMRKVVDFLEAGHKVKIVVFYRGREMAHKDIGFKLAEKITTDLADKAIVEQSPQLAGKQLSFVLRSTHHAKTQNT